MSVVSVSAAGPVPVVGPPGRISAATTSKLTPEQQAAVAQLAVIDRHVRAHEQAHLAAAGPYASGGPSYGYTTGPDGKSYATSGEVSLDVSPDPSGPEQTIQKARVIQAAANAPVDPSSQDRMVAAAAARMEQVAEQALAAKDDAVRSAYQQPDPIDTGTLVSRAL